MTSPKIKVGIVGYGNSARTFHLPFITAITDYEVVAILQRAEAPAPGSDAASKPGAHCTVDFPNARHYREPEAFFADKEIEFVVVVTHTPTHPVFAEQALRAGKHGRDSGVFRDDWPILTTNSARRQTVCQDVCGD